MLSGRQNLFSTLVESAGKIQYSDRSVRNLDRSIRQILVYIYTYILPKSEILKFQSISNHFTQFPRQIRCQFGLQLIRRLPDPYKNTNENGFDAGGHVKMDVASCIFDCVGEGLPTVPNPTAAKNCLHFSVFDRESRIV
jgi:hypothetical protein